MLQPTGALAVVIAVFVHLVVPLTGLTAYAFVLRRMKDEGVPEAPEGSLLLIFGCYGGLLLVLLTGLLWYWSGMASLGAAFLVLVAPFIMGGVALYLGTRVHLSRYHRAAYRAAVAYVPAILLLVALALSLAG